MSSAIFGGSRSSGVASSMKRTDRSLPPLVPPKLVEDEEDFDERDLEPLSPAHHSVQLRPSYWAPTLETLAPEEAEFYRKALVSAMIGGARGGSTGGGGGQMLKRGEAATRSMSMLRMGRSSAGDDGVRRRSTGAANDGVRRSMTMLRMGRAFDQSQEEQNEDEEQEEQEEAKRSMGMLRMGRRAAAAEEDFRKSMSMLRMGRGASTMMDEEDQQQQQLKRSMGMLRMGRRSLEERDQEEDAAEESKKRSMGMLRMGRGLATKSVDRGALNMLRMGKREADEQTGSGVAAVATAGDKSSSSK